MKRKQNFLKVLTSLLMVSLLLSGCTGKKQGADDAAKAYYDLFILGDSAGIEKYGAPKDEAEELIKNQRKSASEMMNKSLSGYEFDLNQEKVEELVDAYLNSLKKLKVETEVVSEEEETATVKISTNYINITDIYTDAVSSSLAEVQALGLTDVKEAQNKYIDLYLDKVIASLKTAEPSSDVIEKTFEFKLQTVGDDENGPKMWGTDNMFKFGLQIGQMVVGMK